MMLRTRSFVTMVVLLAAGFVLAPNLESAGPTPPPISIFFETQLPYIYAGDELTVAVTVKNISDKAVEDMEHLDLAGGIRLEDARGSKVKLAEDVDLQFSKPSTLQPGAFFGSILPIHELFPNVQKPGNYQLTYKGKDASSNSLILRVVEPYHEDRQYQAHLETDFGPIVIEFAKETAPRHVRNFVDLARQGFYEGNQFHRIIRGQAIIGGSPTGDPSVGSGYNLEPELANIPTIAGTVLQVRNKDTGADDSGSHFMILAINKPDLRRRLTVLGRVVEGMDTVKTICQVPMLQSSQKRAGSPGPPAKPVLIRSVKIVEMTENAEK